MCVTKSLARTACLMLLLAAALGTYAANAADGPTPSPGSCLANIWAKSSVQSDEIFDVQNDETSEGLEPKQFVSCQAHTTPTFLKLSLERLQLGLAMGSPDMVAKELSSNFVYYNGAGKPIKPSLAEFQKRFDQIFEEETKVAIGRMQFKDIAYAGWRGAFLRNGFLWWTTDDGGVQPKVYVINRGALPKR